MAWTAKGNIKGPQGTPGATGATGADGPAGTPGEKWFGGTGAPAGNLLGSVVGDWYLNYSTGDVYEKTSSAGWTLRANIKGPTGATGNQGPAGADGMAGEVWFSGTTLPATGVGTTGDWFLNTSTGDFYDRPTPSTWQLRGNLKGPQGNTGATGSTGPAGADGATGAQGPAGVGVPTSGLVIGDHLRAVSTTSWDNIAPNFFAANLTNPTGSSTTAASMAGFGSVAKDTPNASGKLLVIWCGRFNQAGASGTGKVEARYGTGTAPSNGAAATGTVMGNACYITFGQGINQFTITDVISVTKGTAYWFDLTQASGLAGQMLNLFDVAISIVEL